MAGSSSKTSLIYLIGMPGSGKTTLGRQLAAQLKKDFVDLDVYIEEKEGMSIPDIFKLQGEDYFRLLEQQAVKDSIEWENIIVATGGGAPCFFDNIELINNHGTSVFIDVSPEELLKRVYNKGQDKRPLLSNLREDDLFLSIKDKLDFRKKYYTKAHFTITNDRISISDLNIVVHKIE
jgi:shikimate kinase